MGSRMTVGKQVDPNSRRDIRKNAPLNSIEKGRPMTEPDFFRPAKSSDRPQWCDICRAWVPKLRRHVSARHIPWYADAPLACKVCCTQFRTTGERKRHEKIKHSWVTGVLTRAEWDDRMKQWFEGIISPLGLASVADIPSYVRQ